MRKSHIVCTYLIQSAILGLISTLITIPLLHYSFIVINNFMVAGIADSYTLTFSKEGIFVGLMMSISIPLKSTLNSLQAIIKMRVVQGLDNNNPISSMQIQVGPKQEMIGRVVACLIVVVYGLGIYVFIPLTLIKGEIFFMCILLILIGGSLCLGIGFLLMNMCKWANRLTETIVLIFDKPYIMDLVSNVKGIHYSSLSRLVWTIMIGICIVTNLNSLLYCLLSENVLTELRLFGGTISGLRNFTGAELREWSRKNFLKPGEFEQAYILNSETNVYIPKDQTNRALPSIYTSMTTENIGRVKSLKSRIRGVTPNYPDLAATRFVDVEWPTHTSTSLTPFEYLYTMFGYGEVIIPDQMRNKLALDCGTFNNQRAFLYQYHMLNKQPKPYFVNCTAAAKNMPGLEFRKTMKNNHIEQGFDIVIDMLDIPSIVSLHEDQPGSEIDKLFVTSYYIRPSSGILDLNRTKKLLTQFENELSCKRTYIYQIEKERGKQEMILLLLSALLNSMMYGIFIIKFTFGLASILRKQQKEVSVYKSMGMDVKTIARIFFYEVYSTILVGGSYAVIASYILCHLLGLQIEMFTSTIIESVVPISSFVYLFISGLMLSLVSVYIPMLRIAKIQNLISCDCQTLN